MGHRVIAVPQYTVHAVLPYYIMCPIFLYIPPPKMIHMFGHYHPVARYIIPHMPYCTICAISFHVCHIFTLLPSSLMWSTYLSIIICLLCSGLYYIIYICHILHYIPYCTMFDKLYVSMCHIPLFKTILIFGNSNPSPCTLLYLEYSYDSIWLFVIYKIILNHCRINIRSAD